MKAKIIIAVVIVFGIGLAVGYYFTQKKADALHETDREAMLIVSNQVTAANLKINELQQVNLELTNDLAASQAQLLLLSNNLASAATTLANSKAALAGAQDQITALNSHITDLEKENAALNQRAAALTNAMEQLNATITEIRIKLATSETNSAYLQQELQKQMAMKAEIEHKFNDIDTVRQQVKKLRQDAFVARRAQWLANDTATPRRGAELLIRPVTNVLSATAQSNYRLNVEIGTDGSVNVLPGATANTNTVPR